MKLSKDPVKRAIRNEWYWPTMAKYWDDKYCRLMLMLPGAHPWDAERAEECLGITRNHMVCVDKSPGVRAAFTKNFKGAAGITGDVFEVMKEYDCEDLTGAFGLIDLDLCCCANPKVIEGLKALRNNQAVMDGCVLGLTICRRWKTDVEQERRIKKALFPCMKVDQQYYTNSIGGAHMATGIYLLKG